MTPQQKILREFQRRHDDNLPPPTYRDLVEHCGISSTSVVSAHIVELVDDKKLIRIPGAARSVMLSNTPVEDIND